MHDNPTEWRVERDFIRYIVVRRLWANWAGSAYQYAKNERGKVRRFWTKAAAQAYADKLNEGTK